MIAREQPARLLREQLKHIALAQARRATAKRVRQQMQKASAA